MVFTLLAPEFILLKAVVELNSALSTSKILGPRAKSDEVPWSTVHSFFANMGGFVVHFKLGTPIPTPIEPESESSHLAPAAVNAKADEVNTSSLSPATGREDATTSPEFQSPKVLSTGCTTRQDERQDVEVVAKSNAAPDLIIDSENAVYSKAAQNHEGSPTIPADSDPLRSQHEHLCKMLIKREKTMPRATDRNSTIVQEILADLKLKALSGRDTGQPFLDLNDTVLNLLRLRGNYWALNGSQLSLAREMGIIAKVPSLSKSEIEDKSIGDFLVKFLAVIQTLWQIAQLIARYAEKHPASQIEVATVAFGVCAFWTYILFWNKPQDVKSPHVVEATRYPTHEEILSLSEVGPQHITGMFTGYEYSIPEHALPRSLADKAEVLEGGYLGWVGTLLGGMFFGMVHLIAWNFNFPTIVERILWRIATIATSVTPLLWGMRGVWLVAFNRISLQKERKDLMRKTVTTVDRVVFPALSVGIGFLYVLSRVYLLVETFRSTFFCLILFRQYDRGSPCIYSRACLVI